MTVNKLTLPAKENAVQNKINEIIDNLGGGGGGTATDVQINNTSITNNGIANIVTNTAYNASSNKIATMGDVATSLSGKANTSLSNLDNNGYNRMDGFPVFFYYSEGSGTAGSSWVNIGSVARTIGSTTKQPLNILPEDDCSYELYVRVEVHKKANGSLSVGTTANPSDNNDDCWTVRASSASEGGFNQNDGMLVIGTDRVMYVQNIGGTSGNWQIRGYRRLGTNS